MSSSLPILLSIAGSDSGGGAGIQADLKTFEAHGCFGTTAIVALTAQNTQGVSRVEAVSPVMIAAQLEALMADLRPAAIKVGMLGTPEVVSQVAHFLRREAVGIPLVIDPVMVATSGDVLLAPEAIERLVSELLPLATVITPNRHEAALLASQPIDTLEQAQAAARQIGVRAPGAAVLVKGIRVGAESVDVLWHAGATTELTLPWLEVKSTHGTGCTLSSAIAARLARGHAVAEAVALAKAYVHEAIRQAPTGVGSGHGPLRHRVTPPEPAA